MNGVLAKEQRRNIRRVVGEEALGVFEHHSTQIASLINAVEAERKARVDGDAALANVQQKLAKEQNDYIDKGDGATHQALDAFTGQGRLARLRWLFFGSK